MRVYIAGPYTKGDVVENVRAAVFAGDEVFEAGHSPYVPHPVEEGGGACGLENFQTLCDDCHKTKTKDQAGRRADERRAGKRAKSEQVELPMQLEV